MKPELLTFFCLRTGETWYQPKNLSPDAWMELRDSGVLVADVTIVADVEMLASGAVQTRESNLRWVTRDAGAALAAMERWPLRVGV